MSKETKCWRASKGEYAGKYCIESRGVKIYFDKIAVDVQKWVFYVGNRVVAIVQRDQNTLVDPENLLSEVMIPSERWEQSREE